MRDLLGMRPAADPVRVVAALEAAFRDAFKSERIAGFFEHGARTLAIDRLATSEFPGSVRLRLPGDVRATLYCDVGGRVAFVVHVFLKSQDPGYGAAVRLHDARLQAAGLPSLAEP